jgi:hypothetical protein
MTSPVHTSFFHGWQPAQTATVLAALIAVLGVAATLLVTSSRARRDHRADLYADALSGVADYMEGPYRIRHKDGSTSQRLAIQTKLSDIKSSIDHSSELLHLHAPAPVVEAYGAYVRAAQLEAGRQMSQAWLIPPIKTDADANIGTGYPRILTQAYREQVLKLMQAELRRRAWKPWHYITFALAAKRQLDPPTLSGPDPRANERSPAGEPVEEPATGTTEVSRSSDAGQDQ